MYWYKKNLTISVFMTSFMLCCMENNSPVPKIKFTNDQVLTLTPTEWDTLVNQSSYIKELVHLKSSTAITEPIELKEFEKETFQCILELVNIHDPVSLLNQYQLPELVSLAQMIDFLDINALYDALMHAFIAHCKNLTADQIPATIQILAPLENTSLITQLDQALTIMLSLSPEQNPDTMALADKLLLLVTTYRFILYQK